MLMTAIMQLIGARVWLLASQVLGARNVLARDGDTSDPYCKIKYKKVNTIKSDVIKKTVNPAWEGLPVVEMGCVPCPALPCPALPCHACVCVSLNPCPPLIMIMNHMISRQAGGRRWFQSVHG
jgi:hypothetical protein